MIPDAKEVINVHSKAWVSNLRTASLYHAVRCHFCKLSIPYKNYTIIWAVTAIFPRAAREPAHNNGCGPLP